MKIFLTGATGYIGGHLAKKLQESGYELIGLARSDRSAQLLEEKNIEVHRGDLQRLEMLKSGAVKADAVIHSAMPNPADFSDLSELGRIAIQAQAAIIEGLAGQNKIFIATSGTGAYGDTGEQLVDETSPYASDDSMRLFGIMEEEILKGKSQNVRTMIIRPSIVYGHGGSDPVLKLIQSIQQLGYGYYVEAAQSHVSTVHVDDLANLYLLALERAPVGEVFNAVGEIVPTKELVASATTAANVNGEMRPLTVDEVMKQGFIANYLVGNMRVSAEKAKQMLGWRPNRPSILTDLREGSYQ
ncbi:MAG: NAD-dependent epimerase/dehydratase family protein [Ardenticatenaceae bacterium]|nr:NAD-dependent epimerase/dehydratase family protein [Ardenticatenaceae bacterium]